MQRFGITTLSYRNNMSIKALSPRGYNLATLNVPIMHDTIKQIPSIDIDVASMSISLDIKNIKYHEEHNIDCYNMKLTVARQLTKKLNKLFNCGLAWHSDHQELIIYKISKLSAQMLDTLNKELELGLSGKNMHINKIHKALGKGLLYIEDVGGHHRLHNMKIDSFEGLCLSWIAKVFTWLHSSSMKGLTNLYVKIFKKELTRYFQWGLQEEISGEK